MNFLFPASLKIPNSSRMFNDLMSFFLLLANLTEFLLEKSRVVLRGEGELSFHIFYWMFSGISPEEANLYHLHDISKHRFVMYFFLIQEYLKTQVCYVLINPRTSQNILIFVNTCTPSS